MKLKRIYQVLIAGLAFLGLVDAANAVIILSPSTPGVIASNGSSSCEPGCVEAAFGVTGLDKLYRAVYLGGESGTYEESYSTEFSNWDLFLDPSNATLTHRNRISDIDCGGCFLSVKGSNSDPNFYFFDISFWNGSDDLNLQGFWEGTRGAIQQVTIWGGGTSVSKVPEPSTLSLFGLGLLAIGFMRRYKRAN